jgi:hypothetical protein
MTSSSEIKVPNTISRIRKRRQVVTAEPEQQESSSAEGMIEESEPQCECLVIFPPKVTVVPDGVSFALTPIVLGSVQDKHHFTSDGELLSSETPRTFSTCGAAIRFINEYRLGLNFKLCEEEKSQERDEVGIEETQVKISAFEKIYLIAYCPRGGLKSWAVFFNRQDFQEWTLDNQGSFYPYSKTKSFLLDEVDEAINWMVDALKQSYQNLLKYRSQKKQAKLAAMNRHIG